MARYNIGEYISLSWDCAHPDYYAVYGHVERDNAIKAILDEADEDVSNWEHDHCYMQSGFSAEISSKKGRGKMPVTVFYRPTFKKKGSRMKKENNWLVEFVRLFTVIELAEMFVSAVVISILARFVRWS